MASYNTLACTLIRYVKGRLMAVNGPAIYNITSGAAPAALLTHGNTDFAWVDFAEGPTNIYAAGYSGDKSFIYRIGITADGTALDAPVVAEQLPDGEIVRSVHGYLSFLLIGSDKGCRFASIASDGSLTLGGLIPTGSPVYCFEGQDRFIWYGLTNLDGVSTGLGRLDLSQFTKPLTPAYASDLMATGQGTVTSVVTFVGKRVFTAAGLGLYTESTSLVASGSLLSGLVEFGLADAKVAMSLELRHEPLAGSVSAAVAADSESNPTSIGSSSTAGTSSPTSPLMVGEKRGSHFELTLTLTRDAVTTTGPTVLHAVLRVNPAPLRGSTFIVPLMIAAGIKSRAGEETRSPDDDVAAVATLHADAGIVAYQQGPVAYSVFVDDYEFTVTRFNEAGQSEGVLVVKLKEPPS
jgi:hypothetical protein